MKGGGREEGRRGGEEGVGLRLPLSFPALLLPPSSPSVLLHQGWDKGWRREAIELKLNHLSNTPLSPPLPTSTPPPSLRVLKATTSNLSLLWARPPARTSLALAAVDGVRRGEGARAEEVVMRSRGLSLWTFSGPCSSTLLL